MTQSLIARIESAQKSIQQAETRLREAIASTDGGARAAKVEVSDSVRGALSRLRAAKAKLAHLESALSRRQLGAAHAALQEAELELDRAIEGIDVAVRSEKKWMTDVVEQAFDQMREARATLEELEAATAPDED